MFVVQHVLNLNAPLQAEGVFKYQSVRCIEMQMPCIYEGMKADVMLRALVHAAVVLITCISRLVLFIELKENRLRTT